VTVCAGSEACVGALASGAEAATAAPGASEPSIIISRTVLRLEGDCPFHDLHDMTADPDVRYFVPVFACADKNLARTFNLDALFDVNSLFGLRYSVPHHPGRRASCR
jgi:hypothetical protein